MVSCNGPKVIFTVILLMCAATGSAQTFTTLASFDGEDGYEPTLSPLAQGLDANFYGETFRGGAGNVGAVFEITTSGTLTRLRSFDNPGTSSDGYLPTGGLLLTSDGPFYGITYGGGIADCNGSGCGTVFEIDAAGTMSNLYMFCSQPNCADGSTPRGQLVQGLDRNFYGQL